MLLDQARKLNAMGLMEATWDSLDVSLPLVGEAWTEPGYRLESVPFQELLRTVKSLPIERLPALERTLTRLR
jgi:hypothetical protein